MKGHLSQQFKMNQQSIPSSSMRNSSRGEEAKRDLFSGNYNNHLFNRDLSYMHQQSSTGTSQQLEDMRQKRFFGSQNYGGQGGSGANRQSQTPHSTYQSTSEFNRQLSSQKDEPFLARVQQRESRQNDYLKTGSSIEDRPDFRAQNVMSSSEQMFYRPHLDQSPQINVRGQSSSRREYPVTTRMTPLASQHHQSENFQSFQPISQHLTLSGQKESITNQDMEQIILNLHSKMKNLENKYIDLANYYKKELVGRKDISDLHNEISDQQRFKSSGSSYYTRSRSPYHQPDVDQNVESAIISELLQEKNDLEVELKNIINLQYRLQEEDQLLQESLEGVQRENMDLKEELYKITQRPKASIPSGRAVSGDQIEQLKQQVSLLLDKFQGDFLNFINNHYQSFTENDVTGMFGMLRQEIGDIVDTILVKLDQSRQVTSEVLDQQKKEILTQYKKEMEQYELNQEYTLQNIQRCAFELHNKHNTAKLDMKKLSLTLNSLQTSTQQLSGSLPSPAQHRLSGQSFFQQHEARSSSGFRKTGDPSGRQLPPQSPSHSQQRLIGEIQGQVQILSQTFNEMNLKLNNSDSDLVMLQQVESECTRSLTQFKSVFSQFMIQMDTPRESVKDKVQFKRIKLDHRKKGSIDDMVVTSNEDDQSQIIYSKHMEELKSMNDKLQRELEVQIEKFNNVKQENIRLHSELDIQQLQVKASPLRHTYLSIHEQDSSGKKRHSSIQHRGVKQSSDLAQLQARLSLLEKENETQIRQIRSLNRQIDDKNYDIEKLFNENQQLKQAHYQSASSHTLQDQIAVLKSVAEQKQEKLKILMKQALKFVYSMKKLQKAVHNKEPNVQKEKADFEVTRKELEGNLKILKKEFEKEEKEKQDGRAVSTDSQRPQSSSIQQYQNKAPISKTTRITEKPKAQQRASSSSYHQEAPNSFSAANNRFSLSNQSMQNTILADDYNQRSPIIVKNRAQGDLYRSIDAIDRRQNTLIPTKGSLLSSAEKLHQTSPHPLTSHLVSNMQSIEAPQSSMQVQNLRLEIDMLRKELKEELNDKEMLSRTNLKAMREKEQLMVDKQELEMQLDRERRRHDSVKREIQNMELEKETLLQQLSKVSNIHPLKQKEIDEIHMRNRRLEEEISLLDKMNAEYKRTTAFLEESQEAAKQTIGELKEMLSGKELEIEELRTEINLKRVEGGSSPQKKSDSEFRKLKTNLLDQINANSQYCEDQLVAQEQRIQEKEHELAQVLRKLERKQKEKEMLAESANEKALKDKIQALTQEVRDLEEKTKTEELETQIREMQKTHKQELEQVKNKMMEALEPKMKQEIQLVHDKYKKQIEGLERDRDESLKKAKEDLEQALAQKEKDLKQTFDEEFERQMRNDKGKIERELTQKLDNQKNESLQVQQQLENQVKQLQTEVDKLKNQVKKYRQSEIDLDQQLQVEKESQKQMQKLLAQNIQEALQAKLKETERQYKDYIQNLQEQLEQQQSDHEQQLNQAQTLAAEYQQLLEDTQEKAYQSNQQTEQQYQDQISALQEQLAQSNTTLQQVLEQAKNMQTSSAQEVAKLQTSVDKLQQTLQEKDTQIEQYQQSVETLTQDKANLEATLTKLKAELKAQKTQMTEALQSDKQELVNGYETQIQGLEENIAQLKSFIEQTDNQHKQALHTLEQEFLTKQKDLTARISQLESEMAEQAKTYKRKLLEKVDEGIKLKQNYEDIQDQLQQANEELASEQSKLMKMTSELDTQRTQLQNQYSQSLAAQQSQYEQRLIDLQAKHKADVKDLNQKHQEEIRRRKEESEQRTDDLHNQMELITKEKQTLSKSLADAKEENEGLAQQLQSMKEEMSELQTQINQKHENESAQVQSMHAQVSLLHAQIAQKDEQINQVKQQIKDKATEIDQLNDEINGRNKEIRDQQRELSQLSQIITDLENKFLKTKEQSDDTINKLQEDIHDFKQALILKQEEVEAKTQEIEDLTNANELLTQQVSDLKKEIDQLKKDATLKADHQQKKLTEQNQTLQSELHSKSEELVSTKKQLTEFDTQSKLARTISESLQQKIAELQSQMVEKEQQLSSNEQNLQHELKKKEETVKKKNKEIEGLQEMCQDLEQQLADKEEELDRQVSDLKTKLQALEGEKVALESQIEARIQAVNDEKEQLYQELQQMIGQIQTEKEAVEEQLKIQTLHTQSLNTEIQAQSQKIEELKSLVDKKDEEIAEISQKAQEGVESLQEELQEAEETRQKHQQTLENNRKLIQMLKDELQKAVDKQKLQEKEQDERVSNTHLESENTSLKAQIQALKTQFDLKISELGAQIQALEEENRQKTELIDEANKVIEEFNDEKHEIKAKFKHLVQVYDSVMEESSYKEEDDVDLEACFERMEKELYKHKMKQESRIGQLELDNTHLQEQTNAAKEELMQLQAKMGEIQCELMNALNKQEHNDIDMRRQMETAQRKIQNYKEKLMEKQKLINQLETDKKKDSHQNESFTKENNELLMKLQKAEKELQNYRSAQSTNLKRGVSDSVSEQSMKVDMERIQQLEEQLQSLKKQLFQAKDQVIDNLSETFARKIRDLQQIYINEQILKTKLREPNQAELNTMVQECRRVPISNDRALLVIRLQSTPQEYTVIDEGKLSETVLEFLRSFMPAGEHDRLELDDKQQQVIATLEDQIREIREERIEMQQELSLYKQKMMSPTGVGELQDLKLIELEDEAGHLNAENMELRGKIKDLGLQNAKLKVRVLQLNEMIKDMTKSKGEEAQESRLLKLIEENEELKTQLRQRTVEEQKDNEGSFLGGLKAQDPFGEEGDHNLFDQSSLNDVMEHFGKDLQTPTNRDQLLQSKVQKLEQQVEELSRANKNLNIEIQRSKEALNSQEASVIEHIKGTLIQFLKNCPMTEKNNEELLAIVFSMMEFTKEEIHDIQQYRQKARSASQSGTTEPDEEGKKKPKKGILSLFGGKKEKDLSINRQGTSGSSNMMSPSPKPINRY